MLLMKGLVQTLAHRGEGAQTFVRGLNVALHQLQSGAGSSALLVQQGVQQLVP
ncbi:hypothetical protein MNEG_13531, partial [Monoraphidium neglectum]